MKTGIPIKAFGFLFAVFLFLFNPAATLASNFVWISSGDSNWGDSDNWSSGVGGTPGTDDFVIISSTNYSVPPILNGNLTIDALQISGGELDLGTYTLVVTTSVDLDGGNIYNGTLDCRGDMASIIGNSVIDAELHVVCDVIAMANSEFDQDVELNVTGGGTSNLEGGNNFENLTVINSGSGDIYLATSTGDTYSGIVTLTSDPGAIYFASSGTSHIDNQILVNSTGAGVFIGSDYGAVEIALTISIDNAFSSGTLLLMHVTQAGTDEINMTLISDAVLNLIGNHFAANVDFTAPEILAKDNVFDGYSYFTKTGYETDNWEGGNEFKGVCRIINTVAGEINLETSNGDLFRDTVIFDGGNSGGGISGAQISESEFYGDFHTFNSEAVYFNSGSGTYKFRGTEDQLITGTSAILFGNITLANEAHNLILKTPISVSGMLTFETGKIETDTVNLLTILSSGSCTGAGTASFVDGPMKKTGDEPFKFDVGKNDEYNPIEISAPGSISDEFVAEYFDTGQDQGDSLVDSLSFVYDCFYWSLKQTVGSSNVNVTLSWDSSYCTMYNLGLLRCSKWNGTNWIDLGQDTIFGVTAGSLKSELNQICDSYFTFAQARLVVPECDYIPGVVSPDCIMEFICNGDFEQGLPGSMLNPITWPLGFVSLQNCGLSISEVVNWEDFDCISTSDYFISGNTTGPMLCGSAGMEPHWSIPFNFMTCAAGAPTPVPVPTWNSAAGNDRYVGFCPYNEGLRTNLIAPVIANKSYTLSFHAFLHPLAESLSQDYTEYLEVYFEEVAGSPVRFYLPLNSTSFKIEYDHTGPIWTSITYTFTPTTNDIPNRMENLVIKGNSTYSGNLVYSFIDDVSLTTTGPNAVFTYSGDPCINSQLDFFIAGNAGTATYAWDFDDGSTSIANNPSHSFTEPGFYQINCIVADGACSSCFSKIIQIAPTCCYLSPPISYNDNSVVPDEIIADTHWNIDYEINRTITVTNGATLFVDLNTTIYFGPFGRIIVDRGATLVIQEQALLTSTGILAGCRFMWLGIEVWGNSGYDQIGANQAIHGKLLLTGGSNGVSEAHNGVILGRTRYPHKDPCDPDSKDGTWYWPGFSGGILENQNDFDFERNGRSIVYTPYTFQQAYKHENYFFNTSTTTNYLADWGYSSTYNYVYNHPIPDHNPFFASANDLQRTASHIYLNGVRLKEINSCHFYNSQKGIYSFNSGFNADGNNFLDHFIGMDIQSTNSTGLYAHTITHNSFNLIGNNLSVNSDAIKIKAGRGDIIYINHFGNLNSTFISNFVGLRFESTYNYDVFDNDFKFLNRGIVCQNSNLGFGDIHFGTIGNLFYRCNVGIRSVNNNPKLNIRCNNFSNATPSIFISNWINSANSTLPLTQGTLTTNYLNDKWPAGNEWDIATLTRKDIRSTSNSYTYYSHEPTAFNSVYPKTVTPNFVHRTICTTVYKTSTSCDYVSTAASKRVEIDSLKEVIDDYDDEREDLNSGIDDELTDSLLTAISDTTISSYDLRNILSPHSLLSDAVLLAFINRTVVSADSDFVAIIIPNMPVSNDVNYDLFEYLQRLSQNSEDSITEAQGNNPGYRTVTSINRDIEKNERIRERDINDVVTAFLDSSLVDSAIAILEPEHNFRSDVALASLYFSVERFDDAQELLTAIDYDDNEFDAWRKLFQLQLDLVQDSLTLFEMDSTQNAFVDSLANCGVCELATMQAQAIMTFIKGIEYEPCDYDVEAKGGNNINNNDNEGKVTLPEIKTDQLKVFPNPFNSTTLVSYYINSLSEKSVLYLYNSTGQIIKSIPLNKRRGIIQLNAEGLNQGIYLLTLYSGSNKKSLKIIIK